MKKNKPYNEARQTPNKKNRPTGDRDNGRPSKYFLKVMITMVKEIF